MSYCQIYLIISEFAECMAMRIVAPNQVLIECTRCVVLITYHISSGNGESRGSSMSSSLDRSYTHDYGSHHTGTCAPTPPPVPARQLSYSISRDTGIWVRDISYL